MDLFLASCQGLGLALAAGLVLGVVFPPVMPNWGAIAGVAPLGVIAAGAALQGQDEAPGRLCRSGSSAPASPPPWPAMWRPGRCGGRDQLTGAGRSRRPAESRCSSSSLRRRRRIASLIAPPASLVVLVALGWLWLSRRRREARKHEGLRVLR